LWRSQDEMKDLVKTGVWENRTTWQDAVAFAQSDPDGVAIWFDIGENHLRAALRKPASDFEANAPCRAGNERHFAV
jgi:hypothetical protein